MRINLENPCSEDWDDMENDILGRYCTKCSKTVHDFTTSSPQEIIQKISSDNKLCGRFTSDQLDVDFTQSWLKVLLSSLLVSGAITFADAQKANSLFQNRNTNVGTPLNINPSNSKVDCIPPYNCFYITLGRPRRSIENRLTDPLIIVDGKEVSVEVYSQIPTEKIKEVKVLKADNEGIEKYRKKGKNGVIVVALKD